MADPIDGVYCLNCRQIIPTEVADCPHCGAIRGTIPAPAVVAAVRQQRQFRDKLVAAVLIVAFLIALVGMTVYLWGAVSRYQRGVNANLPKAGESRRP